MKVLIHASLDFKDAIISTRDKLALNKKIDVLLPDLTRYQHIRDVNGDDITFTKIKNRLAKESIEQLKECSCLLILNYTHRDIENYVGGNSFMEMSIAFYMNKPIYLLNPIPEGMSYSEEIKAFYPVIVQNLETFTDTILRDL